MGNAQKVGIKASYIVAFDGEGHRILQDGVVVIKDDEIVYVGKDYPDKVHQWLQADDRIVSPGFINTHTHIDSSPITKSFLEDAGNPQFYFSSLFEELIPALVYETSESLATATTLSVIELLRSGTTTVVVMGAEKPELVSGILFDAGLRGYVIPPIRSGSFYTEDGKVPVFRKYPKEGFDLLEKAIDFNESCRVRYKGMINTMLGPTVTLNCTPELLQEIRRKANETGMRVQIHASESVVEFQEILRNHGKTPIQLLDSVGLLGNDLIVGHGIFISGHSWTCFPEDQDLQILGRYKASVAHCPWVFARKGFILESFAKYREAGVNMSLGTDTYPQNMLLEMRFASILSKVHERDPRATTAAHVFDAATLGGANAIGREDLGRICPGAKADLLFFNLNSPRMSPVRDPIKNIVYCADPTDISEVMIDGKLVVEKGEIKGIDLSDLPSRLQGCAEEMWETIPERNWAKKSAEQLAPCSYPAWEKG